MKRVLSLLLILLMLLTLFTACTQAGDKGGAEEGPIKSLAASNMPTKCILKC